VENDRGDVAGSIRALHQLIAHLDRERYEPVVVLSQHRPSPMLPAFEKLGCEIVRLQRDQLLPGASQGARRWVEVPIYRGRSLARDLARAQEIAQVIREHRIDLVHANNNLRSSAYAIWGAALARVPIVCHQRTQFSGNFVVRAGARLVDESLCISQTIYDNVSACGARPKHMRIVYDGVEIPEQCPPHRPIGAAPVILMAGRLIEWKGQHVLIDAAPRVLEQFPDTRFLLAGTPDGAAGTRYQSRLREQVRRLGVGDHVEFLGHVDDLGRLMRESVDIVVHASITPEPFGLVVAEAMAAGKPIVASNSGACPEIVEDGSSGLLFTPGDPASLAAQLIRLLSHPAQTEKMVEQGWTRVRTRFAGERTTREVQDVYHEILGD
jgi:glycosyltransferase involved in cell wall biosynthesis